MRSRGIVLLKRCYGATTIGSFCLVLSHSSKSSQAESAKTRRLDALDLTHHKEVVPSLCHSPLMNPLKLLLCVFTGGAMQQHATAG